MEPYRQQLTRLEAKAQQAFDKTVAALSAGGLGVSFAFVKDFVGADSVRAKASLLVTWAFWVASLITSLTSHYVSTWAMRRAIQALDAGKDLDSVRGWDRAVVVCNAASGPFFVLGAVVMFVFVFENFR